MAFRYQSKHDEFVTDPTDKIDFFNTTINDRMCSQPLAFVIFKYLIG